MNSDYVYHEAHRGGERHMMDTWSDVEEDTHDIVVAFFFKPGHYRSCRGSLKTALFQRPGKS